MILQQPPGGGNASVPTARRGPAAAATTTTVSGFSKREAYRAFDAALLGRHAERACCLAAELVATPGELRRFVSHLADVYATSYVSVDGAALARFARACAAMARAGGDARSPGVRRGMCEAVIALAIGLPRQDTCGILLGRVRAAVPDAVAEALTLDPVTVVAEAADQHQQQHQQPPISSRGLELARLIREGGRAPEAVLLANHLLSDPSASASVGALACCCVWDACDACACVCDAAESYVADARLLYHLSPSPSTVPTKATRTRRKGLALCAVLVASASNRSGGILQQQASTWAGQAADVAIEQAYCQLHTLFGESPTECTPEPATPATPTPPPTPPKTTIELYQEQQRIRQQAFDTGIRGVDRTDRYAQSGTPVPLPHSPPLHPPPPASVPASQNRQDTSTSMPWQASGGGYDGTLGGYDGSLGGYDGSLGGYNGSLGGYDGTLGGYDGGLGEALETLGGYDGGVAEVVKDSRQDAGIGRENLGKLKSLERLDDQMSYLQMYTTYDGGAEAWASASRRETHLDIVDDLAASKVIPFGVGPGGSQLPRRADAKGLTSGRRGGFTRGLLTVE